MTKRMCSVDDCDQPSRSRGWCTRHYDAWRRHGDLSWTPPSRIDRFWSMVDKNGPNGCWLWTGYCFPTGYGEFHDGNGGLMAHRYAYWLATSTEPGDQFVCHTCDVPACVNPRHLFLGTHQDNMTDMVTKGRSLRLYGDESHHHKLSSDDVATIRLLLSQGATQRTVADRFGVSQGAISMIHRRLTWGHLP